MINPSILITGANGLIGQELIAQLIKNEEIGIRAIDIRETSSFLPNVQFFNGDINDLPEYLFDGIDTVIHLASVIGVEYTESNPLQTIETITTGTRKMLELSSKHRVSRFVMTSSSEVYGDISTQPLTENDPVSPKSVYGSAKLTAEYLCKAYQKEFGQSYTILRIFNAFGKYQSNKFVIPLFVERALKGETIEIFGDGSQTRSFCHVSDVARYIAKAAELDSTENKTYNIGDPRNNPSIYELAMKILGLVGNSTSAVKLLRTESHFSRDPAREVQHRKPDISTISAICGFEPIEDFTEKLLDIIDFKREMIGQNAQAASHMLGANHE